MDRSRAAYTGPPPPRNYGFKKKEEFRKRDSYRPIGDRDRPVNTYRPYRPTMGQSSGYSGSYRPALNQNMPGNQQLYNSNWRPRGAFRSNRPMWRPRPDRTVESFKGPQKSWKKAKIVIKEKSSDDSDDSRMDFAETSAQNESGQSLSSNQVHQEQESGQIYDTNEDSGQLYEEESGQIFEEESGQILEEGEDENIEDQIKEEEKDEDEDSEYDQDYIEEQIDKIDNEISRLETQLAAIRAKKEDEDLKESKVEIVKNSWDDLDKPTLNDEELIEKVYSDNRKIVLNIDYEYSVENFSPEDCQKNYLQIGSETVTSLLQRDLEKHAEISPIISKYIALQKRNHLIHVTSLALEYKERNFVWKRKIDKMVAKYEKRKSDIPPQSASTLPSPVVPSVPSPVTPNTQVGSSRNRRSGFRSDYVKSESELASALIALGVDPAEVELDAPKNVPQDDPSRLAIEPQMILDPLEKDLLRSFKSTIGLVEDPVKSLKDFNSTLELNWHNEEKDIFKTRLLQHGKNFRKIASYLPLKSTADCIQYFYREKINLGFKQAIRRGVNAGQRGRKKAKSRQDVDHSMSSFRIWKLNSDEELPRQRQGLLRYVSWDPAEHGKEDFIFEDPDECITPWTNEEQAAALKALEEYGKDYSSISQVLGNKSEDQIRSFYANYKRKQKKQKLEEMKQIMKEIRDPGSRNSADHHQDYDWESDGRRRGKKRNIKRKEDDIIKKKPKNKTEMDDAVSTNTMGNADDLSRRTISYWSVSEKAQFISSLKVHGRKWELIANDVGTKSAVQVRNFFSNSRTKLNLDQILAENEKSMVEEQTANEVKLEATFNSNLQSNMGILLTSPSSLIINSTGTSSLQYISQQIDDPNAPLSPSRNPRTLPPPSLSASTSPRLAMLDPTFNDILTLPPMRNKVPPLSERNVGLGITKISQLLDSGKNGETTQLDKPTDTIGGYSGSSVINSVNKIEEVDNAKQVMSGGCEDMNPITEVDNFHTHIIKIDSDPEIIQDSTVAQVVELRPGSMEKLADIKEKIVEKDLQMPMNAELSNQMIKLNVKVEQDSSQQINLEDQPNEDDHEHERQDLGQTLNPEIEARKVEATETNEELPEDGLRVAPVEESAVTILIASSAGGSALEDS